MTGPKTGGRSEVAVVVSGTVATDGAAGAVLTAALGTKGAGDFVAGFVRVLGAATGNKNASQAAKAVSTVSDILVGLPLTLATKGNINLASEIAAPINLVIDSPAAFTSAMSGTVGLESAVDIGNFGQDLQDVLEDFEDFSQDNENNLTQPTQNNLLDDSSDNFDDSNYDNDDCDDTDLC